jgi:hypothetical protein
MGTREPSPEAESDEVVDGTLPDQDAPNFSFTDPYGNTLRFTYTDAYGNPAPVKIAIEYANGHSIYLTQSDSKPDVFNCVSNTKPIAERVADSFTLAEPKPYYPTGPDYPEYESVSKGYTYPE